VSDAIHGLRIYPQTVEVVAGDGAPIHGHGRLSTERSDVDLLLRAHAGDPKLRMYRVELEHDFPDPSDRELRPAAPDEGGTR
jgi:hypothetical protein